MDFDKIMELWGSLPESDDAAAAAFREFYADPVEINGTPVTAAALVERARMLATAIADQRREIIDLIDTPGGIAVHFQMFGRHVGSLETRLGALAPTGREVEIRVMDILTFTDGRISKVGMIMDELGLAQQVAAITVAPVVTPTAAPRRSNSGPGERAGV